MSRFFRLLLSALALLPFFLDSVAEAKSVVLTFDDGPHPFVTERILSILEEKGIPATFFLVGLMIDRNPDLAKLIYEKGFEIGNHTYSDTRLTSMSPEDIKGSLEKVNLSLEKITGSGTTIFRPPGGRINARIAEQVSALGYRTVMWTRYVNDTKNGIDSKEIIARATKDPKAHEVILLHSGPVQTIKALPDIIDFYKKRGYAFRTVSSIMPPISQNSLYVVKRKAENWPIFLWDDAEDFPLSKEPSRNYGNIALVFSFVSGSIVLVGYQSQKRFQHITAPVFINVPLQILPRLCEMLRIENIKAAFVLSAADILAADEALKKQLLFHDLALGITGDQLVGDSISEWEGSLGILRNSALPLCYMPEVPGLSIIHEISSHGYHFLALKHKPIRAEESDFIREYARKLYPSGVIPVDLSNIARLEVVLDMLDKVREKGYTLHKLNDIIFNRYLVAA